MDKDRLLEGFSCFSTEEREVLLRALEQGQRELVADMVLARRRSVQRAASDAETDQRRRLLVGARLPRQTAERYRECARSHGLSLYSFVCSALEREYKRWQWSDSLTR